MAVVAIVQARMGSSRFPGKMVADLGPWPLVEWVLARTAKAISLDKVILATSDKPRDDVLCSVADRLQVEVFRGDEDDVLGRYSAAARAANATTVVRICGDRPLVDPAVIDLAVKEYCAGGADLTFNHIPDGNENWPRGFGAEVLSASLLHEMAEGVDDPYHREHVTSFLWNDRTRHHIRPAPCPVNIDPGFAGLRLDVDEQEDLDLLQKILPAPDLAVSAEAVIAAWRRLGSETDAFPPERST
ncbi:MAG: hypothetical protein HOL07_16180 [Rhodospirillaceae bacterium]|jgi:spore coat polysaccharide biosynthesis protein SpsF|nr:hypothetical protein [Rhodospirillaceae bacterium]MBT3810355.1 hypothetical protein [Rhodospirillaceae bacterium]MBT3931044.1 hypothetical protein [Rhodospirillaceae bacterium]MBT4773578.1 hypothetical protein [Rhodospirillaceae bacterium]MBT5359881.1 hypothetical protein [Rhodospirillaceae bacterium]